MGKLKYCLFRLFLGAMIVACFISDRVQVESEGLHQSDPLCYNSGQVFKLSCSDKFITVEGIKVGATLDATDCSNSNCCGVNTSSDCIFDYNNIFIYQLFCNGKHTCDPEPGNALTWGHCNNTYNIASNYMYIIYSCTDGNDVASMCSPNEVSVSGSELFIWNDGFPSRLNYDESLCICTIQSGGYSFNVQMQTIQRDLTSDSGGNCEDPLRLDTIDAEFSTRWSCADNIYTVENRTISLADTNEIFLQSNRTVGTFWIRFKAMNDAEKLMIHCTTGTNIPSTVSTTTMTTTTNTIRTTAPHTTTTATEALTTTTATESATTESAKPSAAVYVIIAVVLVVLVATINGLVCIKIYRRRQAPVNLPAKPNSPVIGRYPYNDANHPEGNTNDGDGDGYEQILDSETGYQNLDLGSAQERNYADVMAIPIQHATTRVEPKRTHAITGIDAYHHAKGDEVELTSISREAQTASIDKIHLYSKSDHPAGDIASALYINDNGEDKYEELPKREDPEHQYLALQYPVQSEYDDCAIVSMNKYATEQSSEPQQAAVEGMDDDDRDGYELPVTSKQRK